MTDIDTKSLSLTQKASLLSGGGFWSTVSIPTSGIEQLVLTDGPHGVRLQSPDSDSPGITDSGIATCFPPAVAVGSSWNPEVAARLGAALAREARGLGVHVLLGPGINIKRVPLGGRNFEYYSEDPHLSGVLGAAFVNALQAGGAGASVKHFAANDQETERMRISADVDERTLREVHLSAFERVVIDARPATVMCSYNRINGIPASENRWLLTDILRGEWDYSGVVVSDWGAVRNRVAALAAGLDLAMPGTGDLSTVEIVTAVESGQLEEAAVDNALRRVLTLQSLVSPTPAAALADADLDAHHALARELAAECVVLLRNEHKTLPLAVGQSVLVVGDYAISPRLQGGGSSHVNAAHIDVPLDIIKAHAATFGLDVSYESDLNAAVTAARSVDVAIVFAGLAEVDESEGFDRTSLDLPAEEVRWIREVAAAAPRTVVVLANGGIVSLEGWHDQVDTILEGFLLGQGGGSAIADILFGVTNPSGRLAETIPLRLEDTPTYHNFPGEQGRVRYGEGVMVGYRHYETVRAPVRYPFGHGLSYTTFSTSNVSVDITGTDSATTTVAVTNDGPVAGQEVIQIYLATTTGPVRRPARLLAAFAKVSLEPGETRTVTLELDRRAFRFWDIELHRWIVAAGDYTIEVCRDASSVLVAETITLEGDDVVLPLSTESSVAEWFAHPVAGPALKEKLLAAMEMGGRATTEIDEDSMRMVESMPLRQLLRFSNGSIDEETLMALVSTTV